MTQGSSTTEDASLYYRLNVLFRNKVTCVKPNNSVLISTDGWFDVLPQQSNYLECFSQSLEENCIRCKLQHLGEEEIQQWTTVLTLKTPIQRKCVHRLFGSSSSIKVFRQRDYINISIEQMLAVFVGTKACGVVSSQVSNLYMFFFFVNEFPNPSFLFIFC